MATVFLKSQTLTNIANAIRVKLGTTATMTPGEMADNINAIQTGSTGTDISDATATSGDIMLGKTAYVATGKVVGTKPNIYTRKVYTMGGVGFPVTVGDPDADGDACLTVDGRLETTSAEILSGKKAITDNGVVTGSMTNQGAKTASLNCGGSYTIPAGYHNGSGKVTANSLASQTAGTATAADIASGKTAWVGGRKITGTAVATDIVTGTFTPSDVLCSVTIANIVGKSNIFIICPYSKSTDTRDMTFMMKNSSGWTYGYIGGSTTTTKPNVLTIDESTGKITISQASTSSDAKFWATDKYHYIAW